MFDVAASVLVVEIERGAEQTRRDLAFDDEQPGSRAARLARTGADVLVCGAISRPLEMAVSAAGIEVIPQTCGEVEHVLTAFIEGRLDQTAFLMPGCCGRRRPFRRRRRCGRRRGRRGRTRPESSVADDGAGRGPGRR